MTRFHILSYYGEYLVKHIMTMIGLVDPSSRAVTYGEYLVSLFYSTREENLYRVNFYDLLELSIILHDIGKAFYRPGTQYSYLSFTGHEVLSTIIANELIQRCIEQDPEYCPSRDVFIPVLYSILFHHHAMDITTRARKVASMWKRRILPAEPYVTGLLEDYKALQEHTSPFTRLLLGGLREAVEEIAAMENSEIISVFNSITRGLLRRLESGDVVIKRLMHLTLASLIALDYEAAYRVRGGVLTVFGSVCREWGRLYLGFRV